jgi:Zn-dependent protease
MKRFLEILGLIFIIVFVHEAGHTIAAYALHADIKTFSIGFGPALFSYVWNDVTIKFAPILLGGYVQIDPKIYTQDYLINGSVLSAVIIMSAGVAMNFIMWFLFKNKLKEFASFNKSIAWFNILPIPILDGHKILGAVVCQYVPYKIFDQYSMYALVGLVGGWLAVGVVFPASMFCYYKIKLVCLNKKLQDKFKSDTNFREKFNEMFSKHGISERDAFKIWKIVRGVK